MHHRFTGLLVLGLILIAGSAQAGAFAYQSWPSASGSGESGVTSTGEMNSTFRWANTVSADKIVSFRQLDTPEIYEMEITPPPPEVPEPMTIVLFGLGMTAMGLGRKLLR